MALQHFFGLQIAIKVIGILQTAIFGAKDTGIVPGNALDNTTIDIDNGRQKWKDATFYGVIIDSKKTQTIEVNNKSESEYLQVSNNIVTKDRLWQHISLTIPVRLYAQSSFSLVVVLCFHLQSH